MNRLLLACVTLAGLLLSAEHLLAQQGMEHGSLKYVDAVRVEELQNVVSIDVSADGRFVYTAAYNAKAVCVFPRDTQSGKFSGVQTLSDTDKLDGVTALRLSPDGRYAATAAFRSHAVMLLRRDAQEGSLYVLDAVLQRDDPQLKLTFAIDVAWSPDSRFVYAIAPSSAAVNVLEVGPQEKLTLVQAHTGDGRCFAGARGICVSPDGSLVYVASEAAGTLTVLQRDVPSGALVLKQIVQDEQDGVKNLAGAFSVAVGPEGKHVYVSSGRFRGDSAISVFQLREEGDLKLVQELVDGTPELHGFVGGNEILVTRDGRNAYAVASRSHSLVSFRRDPTNGKLTQLQTLVHETDGVGPLAGVSGLGISPDGKFLYAAAEADGAISIFHRKLVP